MGGGCPGGLLAKVILEGSRFEATKGLVIFYVLARSLIHDTTSPRWTMVSYHGLWACNWLRGNGMLPGLLNTVLGCAGSYRGGMQRTTSDKIEM